MKIQFYNDTQQPITEAEFLAQYWQKKPLLIRQGFSQFEDLISPDELAGLALDSNVQSRLIYQQDDQWQADFGPFESYEHLGEAQWSLVVQAADNWSPEVAELTTAFGFLPHWRRDDVMISFATPGGSVGPHVDNYDTFICQGSGSRRWRVGDKGHLRQFSAHENLLHVERFDAIIDVELQSGDILYIPPGYPHEGIALSASMSFSVGFRTESGQDLFSALADHLLDNQLGEPLYGDPDRPICQAAGLIDSADINRIKQHLVSVLNDEALFAGFCASHLSQPKHTLDIPESGFDYTVDDVKDILRYQPLYRLGGLRCFYTESQLSQGVFYVNGERVQLDPSLAPLIQLICNETELNGQQLSEGLKQPEFIGFLTDYICQGCWYFEEIDD